MPTRRQALAAAAMTPLLTAAAPPPPDEPFGYCLNTSTLRGQNLTLPTLIEVAARAGYTGIEPWLGEIEQYVTGGGTLKDLAKRIADRGMTVEDGIAFAEWIVDDDARRAKGLELAKRQMDTLRQLGCTRLAAPPAGATEVANFNLAKAAERYAKLAEAGRTLGVVPLVEIWGFSKTLRRLSDALYIAAESGFAKAAILPDVYHLHRGGSGFAGLRLVAGGAIGLVHVNDFPAAPAADKLTDAQRVYPGDGAAPWPLILRALRDSGYRGMLSLELFNRDYWMKDAFEVARSGLEKLRAVVRAAFAEPKK